MLLYHCFPRRRECKCDWCAKSGQSTGAGIKQLQAMMEYGLVLTPENLTIPPNPRATDGEPPRTNFTQTRACFTLADRNELWSEKKFLTDGDWWSHCEVFGQFAVGLTSESGRRLGAVPVMYFYPDLGNDGDRVNMTHEALFVLRELRSLAIALAWIEAKAPSSRGQSDVWTTGALEDLGHVLEGEELARERIGGASSDDAEKVAYLLETKRPAACNLVERMNILLGFFQSTDAPKSRGGAQHGYYEQREWRIGQVYGPHVQTSWLDEKRGADDESVVLRRRLRTINPCFFDRCRLKDSAVLRGLAESDEGNRLSFFDFVTEVICPSTEEPAVGALVEAVGFRKTAELKGSRAGQEPGARRGATVFIRNGRSDYV